MGAFWSNFKFYFHHGHEQQDNTYQEQRDLGKYHYPYKVVIVAIKNKHKQTPYYKIIQEKWYINEHCRQVEHRPVRLGYIFIPGAIWFFVCYNPLAVYFTSIDAEQEAQQIYQNAGYNPEDCIIDEKACYNSQIYQKKQEVKE